MDDNSWTLLTMCWTAGAIGWIFGVAMRWLINLFLGK